MSVNIENLEKKSFEKSEVFINEKKKNEEVVKEIEEVKEPVVEEKKPDTLVGVVSGCSKLNLRKEPNTKCEVLQILKDGEELLISINKSTSDFYKVITESGVEGYCMKDYVFIN